MNKLGPFGLEKKKLKWNHLTVFKYLNTMHTEGGAVIIPVVPRGSGHILRHRRFL